MGRKKGSSTEEKKTPVKLRPIARKHAGKITEPWAIMEKMIAEKPCFEHLKVAKIKLWWQKDWKADVDGIATGAQVCKASEIDRNLAEESGGETVDLFIKLPEQQWPTLDETEKRHRIFHELCHIRPAKNAEGNQKRDSKDRLLWRLRRHPITAFPEEIEEFGIERVIGHNASVLDSIRLADRPMEKLFDQAEANAAGANGQVNGETPKLSDPEPWLTAKISEIGFKSNHQEALELAGIHTAGELQQRIKRHGDFWPKESGVHTRFKTAIEDVFNTHVSKQCQAAEAAQAATPQSEQPASTNGEAKPECVPVKARKAKKGRKRRLAAAT